MTKLRPEIVLLDSMMDLGDIEELANIFSKIDISGVVRCLYWSAPVAEILKNRYNLKIDFEYALDYLNQQDLEEIDARIGEWLCNWYKDKELKKYKEFIFYKDFSLSNFIDNELGNLFIYIMKNIIAMHKFIMKKDNYNYAMVISKTEVYLDLCSYILKEKGINYKIYRFSHTKTHIFYKPVFYNWGLIPDSRAALISTLYSGVEILSNLMRFVKKGNYRRQKIIVIDHKILKPAIDRLLEQGYEVFFPNNIRRFLSKEAIKKRIYYVNTFSSMRLDLINYIFVRLFTVRSTFLAKQIYRKLLQIKENRDFFIFRDIDFSSIIKVPFVNMLKKFPVFLSVSKKIDQQLKQNKFDLFFTNSAYGETKVYWHLCKKYGIKSVGYLHGISMKKKFPNHNINYCDYLFVWGPKIKAEYLSRGGFAGKEQIAVGNIKYDFINLNEKFKKEDFGLDNEKKVILFDYYDSMDFCFYCFYPTDYYDRVLFALLKIMPKFKDTALIIKVHPSGNPQRCRYLLRYFKLENKVIILHKEDVMSLIPICSAIVSPGATTLCIDTIVNNVPFIAANFNKFPYIPYQGYRAFIEVFNEKELEEALKKVIADSSFLESYKQDAEEFIRDFAYKLDSNSTERFVSTLAGLLEK